MLETIISGLIKGLIEPFLRWWSTYSQGRNAQQVDDFEASLRKIQEVYDAQAKIKFGEYYIDLSTGRVRRRDPDPPASVPGGPEPDAQ